MYKVVDKWHDKHVTNYKMYKLKNIYRYGKFDHKEIERSERFISNAVEKGMMIPVGSLELARILYE